MKKHMCAILLLIITILSGCSSMSPSESTKEKELLSSPPHGVYYEIFVRSFYDSDDDGIGDLNGVTEKLDYLSDLGIEGIWLMPINKSPSYHGYDVTDYKSIDPDYGSSEDFKTLVEEAHERDIKILMDLVVNHTSKRHPWFEDASSSEESPYRDWYIWANDETNTTERGEWSQTLWHGSSGNKYYGVFWQGMPDLNFDNPEVREEMIDIGEYWLEEYNIDGYRLDAAKHIFDSEEKNHEWWREFNSAMKDINENALLVGEVWDSATIVGPYLDGGLDSTFNFDLSANILNSVKNESDGIVSSLTRTRSYFNDVSDEYIDSTFITNHDMNRVMSELNGDVEQAKMAASILLTLPGNPFIYYGEEIGMEGQKPDENIREPMIWSVDKEKEGQASWMIAKHNKDREAISVEAQMEDDNSLLNHYKKLIHTRRSTEILIEGEIEKSDFREDGILTFKRTLDDQSLLVIHNLSDEEKQISLGQEYEQFFSTNDEVSLESSDIIIPGKTTTILE
ncbi:alpha-amylase family glycosyl hydrolase [Aquibacillus albus]|uniref:Alpha-amylase n=1 Tax=Aquibacillus albus TaxID=1168171 RepID=A0ABS2MY63_9BACI|nr:alpha-amylase family glycosyl hydrolase [Aquibacillus albus]MBM7570829.1 glycosidase [Aquibacillus albus]